MTRAEAARVLRDASETALLAAEAVDRGDDSDAAGSAVAALAALELVAGKLMRDEVKQ